MGRHMKLLSPHDFIQRWEEIFRDTRDCLPLNNCLLYYSTYAYVHRLLRMQFTIEFLFYPRNNTIDPSSDLSSVSKLINFHNGREVSKYKVMFIGCSGSNSSVFYL